MPKSAAKEFELSLASEVAEHFRSDAMQASHDFLSDIWAGLGARYHLGQALRAL